jgi:hypothetical protein
VLALKKPTQKTHLKNQQKNFVGVFFKVLIFNENITNFSL